MEFKEEIYVSNGNIQTKRHDKGAFPYSKGGHITICVTASEQSEIESIKAVLHSDGYDAGEREITLCPAEAGGKYVFELSFDILLALSDKCLYYYHYVIKNKDGSEHIYGGESSERLTENTGDRQLMLYSEDYKTPDFLRKGGIYQIFVDRFRKSGKCKVRPDGKYNPDFEYGKVEYPPYRGADFESNEFFGGDLYGVAEKLDYIKSLGCTTLYLNPIFSSPSNHKYDTEDYMTVDNSFGGDEALLHLISECKKRNMHIILDGVFNHTGADSIYFDIKNRYTNGAFRNPNSPYAKWYFFRENGEYDCWWGNKNVPKVDCDCDSYRKFILGEGGVVEKYMKMGIDGFRIDVADELSDGFLEELRMCVKKLNPDGVIIGEVWEDASNKVAYSKRRHYLTGNQLDSVMNYPLRDAIISFIKKGNNKKLEDTLEIINRHYPDPSLNCLMNFLGTHDTERILTVLGTDYVPETNSDASSARLSQDERKTAFRKLRCAYALCALAYGVPSVYYGDEAGLEGYHDPFCRAPFPWGHENTDYQKFVSEINNFRNSNAEFTDGVLKTVESDENFFTFDRFLNGNRYRCRVTVTRNSSHTNTFSSNALCVFGNNAGSVANSFTTEPYSIQIFKFTP